jgi:hypothetical protein
VGDPARADLAFAKAALEVLLGEAADRADRLLAGRLEGRHRRSPFGLVPFLRTDFWPVAGAALAGGLAGLVLGRQGRSSGGRVRAARSPATGPAHTPPTPD